MAYPSKISVVRNTLRLLGHKRLEHSDRTTLSWSFRWVTKRSASLPYRSQDDLSSGGEQNSISQSARPSFQLPDWNRDFISRRLWHTFIWSFSVNQAHTCSMSSKMLKNTNKLSTVHVFCMCVVLPWGKSTAPPQCKAFSECLTFFTVFFCFGPCDAFGDLR